MASVNFCSCSWLRLSTHQKASCGSCPGWQWGQFTPGHYFLWLPFGQEQAASTASRHAPCTWGARRAPGTWLSPIFPDSSPKR